MKLDQAVLCQCDGCGSIPVYFLHTWKRTAGGSCFKEKKQITAEVYAELQTKELGPDQSLHEGVKPCSCRKTA